MASAFAYPIHLKVGPKRRNPQGTAVMTIRHIDTNREGLWKPTIWYPAAAWGKAREGAPSFFSTLTTVYNNICTMA